MNHAELQKSLPENLAEIISGYHWRQISLGMSPSKVFRLEAANKKSLYLKIAPCGVPGFSLARERQILDWLDNRLPAPQVVFYDEDATSDYLLISEISGLHGSRDELKSDVPRLIERLIDGLKTIHNLPVENCPFDERMNRKIDIVRQRIASNLIEEKAFDDERLGKTPGDLFAELLSKKPAGEDLVFTHGDCCLPNVIFENGRLNGFIDWGNAGVADRYHDLAILSRSVVYNFGQQWEHSVFEAYGIEPDLEKIHFYRLLDEFF